MVCSRCKGENPQEKLFCGDCGFPLVPGITYLEEKLDQQVEKAISARFTDQRLVALETSDLVLNRITSHVKLVLWLGSGIVALILLGITILGLRKYNDFASLVQQAETQVLPKLDAAKEEGQKAERAATDATQAAAQAKHDIEQVNRDVQGELKKASGITSQVQALSGRVSDVEKQTTGKISEANQHVSAQVSDLDAKVATALGDISRQQEKLANTDELVETLFSKGLIEIFPIVDSPRFVALPFGGHVDVYILLKQPPIFQTLELQWHVYVQPKNSYFLMSNVIVFNWGQTLDALKPNPLIVSYIPDPRVPASVKQLTAKDGTVFADGQALPKM